MHRQRDRSSVETVSVETVHAILINTSTIRSGYCAPKSTIQSKGLVLVPHQVMKMLNPTVSKILAATFTPTVSSGLFSEKSCTRKPGAEVAAKTRPPR